MAHGMGFHDQKQPSRLLVVCIKSNVKVQKCIDRKWTGNSKIDTHGFECKGERYWCVGIFSVSLAPPSGENVTNTRYAQMWPILDASEIL